MTPGSLTPQGPDAVSAPSVTADPTDKGPGLTKTTPALEVTITAPIVSFRNPLYSSVQICLPCPPPSTVGGLLAAAAGGWQEVDPTTTFAMAFHAHGQGIDLETYHPLDASGKKSDPTPRDREFLSNIVLTLWLTNDIDLWNRRCRRPVWALRLGRSQDLVNIGTRFVELTHRPGRQESAVLPSSTTTQGIRLRLPTAISLNRSTTLWDDYRFDPAGRATTTITHSWSDNTGRCVLPLPPTHPDRT